MLQWLPQSWRIPVALKIAFVLIMVLIPYYVLPIIVLPEIGELNRTQQETQLQRNTNAYAWLLGEEARSIRASVEGVTKSASVERAWGAYQESIDLETAGLNQHLLQRAISDSQIVASLDYLAVTGPRGDLYLAHGGGSDKFEDPIPPGLLRTISAMDYPREIETLANDGWRWAIDYFSPNSPERTGTYLMVGGPVYMEKLNGFGYRFAGCIVGGRRISASTIGNPAETAEVEPIEVLLAEPAGNLIWSTLDPTAAPDQLLHDILELDAAQPRGETIRWRNEGVPHLVNIVDVGGMPDQVEQWHLAPWLIAIQRESPSTQLLAEFRRTMNTSALFLLFLALCLSIPILSPLSLGLRNLAQAARRYAEGEQVEPVIPQTRDELQQLGEAFADMVVQRQEALARMIRAEKLAAWRDFARKLAHEIKNPLQPIRLHMELLARTASRNPERVAGQVPEASSIILQEVDRLKRLADEFSDFARMPLPELAPTNVEPIVQHVVSLVEPQWPSVAFRVDLPEHLPPFALDEQKLTQLLLNLLKNAAEAALGADIAQPRIVVRGIDESDGSLTLLIEDNGPGIPADQLEHLFTPYFTTKEKEGGTGLGLVVVQRIMTEHGGTVTVASAPGEGTSFRLSFPAGLRLTPQSSLTENTPPPDDAGGEQLDLSVSS